MNYEEMSDFEVNRAVACRLDGNDLDIFGRPMFASDCYFTVPSGSSVEWHQIGCDESKLFDPCNNPSDAWPIIDKHSICIHNDEMEGRSYACSFDKFGYVSKESYCDNTLRAAMIVFLMMQE